MSDEFFVFEKSAYFLPSSKQTKSPLKWMGGKYRVLPEIFHDLLPTSRKRFLEPFFGGGSVGLNIDPTSISDGTFIINDTNKPLMAFWKAVRNSPREFIENSKYYFDGTYNNTEKYYELREIFNETNDQFLKGVLFLYLNKHCFNGLCRFNKSGKFNAAYGKYTNPPNFPQEEIKIAAEKLVNYDLLELDFRDILLMAEDGDAIYCDPPYLPLSDAKFAVSYGEKLFSEQDQIDLANLAMQASKKGARVVISNHWTEKSLEIYKHAKTRKISVKRTISQDGDNRKAVDEILAVYG